MAFPDARGSGQPEASPNVKASSWAPFQHRVFIILWVATVVSNVGGWMYSAASSWLMTSLDAKPLTVSLVQAANALPMFLFAVPAGALADIIDKRRFIIVLEILITIVSAIFAALVSADLVGPVTLLLFTFLISLFGALEAPAWQSIVPQLVPKQDLAPAIAANSVGINISRAIGPAIGGVIIIGFGIAAPFWLNAISNLGVIGVLLWWRSPQKRMDSMPAERFTSAIRSGFRYMRHNRRLRATLARAVGFFLFASAYWALLPLVARNQIAGGPELYGALLGAIGVGAVGAAFGLPWLKAKIGADLLVAAGEVGTAATLVLFGTREGTHPGSDSKFDSGYLVDRRAGNAQRFGSVCIAGLGARAGTCDVCHGVFWNADDRKRALGTSCGHGGSAAGSFRRGRRRPHCDSADVALQAAYRSRSRSHAIHALAYADRHPGN